MEEELIKKQEARIIQEEEEEIPIMEEEAIEEVNLIPTTGEVEVIDIIKAEIITKEIMEEVQEIIMEIKSLSRQFTK